MGQKYGRFVVNARIRALMEYHLKKCGLEPEIEGSIIKVALDCSDEDAQKIRSDLDDIMAGRVAVVTRIERRPPSRPTRQPTLAERDAMMAKRREARLAAIQAKKNARPSKRDRKAEPAYKRRQVQQNRELRPRGVLDPHYYAMIQCRNGDEVGWIEILKLYRRPDNTIIAPAVAFKVPLEVLRLSVFRRNGQVYMSYAVGGPPRDKFVCWFDPKKREIITS